MRGVNVNLNWAFWALCATFISGCAGFEDAQIVVNERGPAEVFVDSPIRRDKVLSGEGVAKNPNLLGIFVDSYSLALASPDSKETSYAMAKAGYDLVDNYCYSFFRNSGENQKWLDFSKDIVAAIGTLGTGISAISNAGGSTTKIIALSTATAYNGVDIYTRNFLFGAENVDSVRTLIVNALGAHRVATIGADGAEKRPWTFGSAILQIQNHQAICQSAKIRDLVLQAVKGGTVTAFTPDGQTVGTGGGSPTPAAAPKQVPNLKPAEPVNIKAGS